MKKLLLTLFAVAAVFVACDKEEAIDIQEPTVIEMDEANASIEISDDFIDGLVSRLSNYEVAPKNGPSSARTTSTTPCADNVDATPVIGGVSYTNRFDLDYFANSGQNYLLVRSEDASATAEFTPTFSFALAKNSDNRLVVIINGAATVRGTLSTTFSNLFEIPGFSLVETADADLNYSGDSTLAAAGLECSGGGVDYTGFYTVTPAPFPLTGFLARITGDLTGIGNGTSLNYAASTEAAVREAIENDIRN